MPDKYPYKNHVSDMPFVNSYSGGVPVWSFGYTHVYGAPPDLIPSAPLQKENQNPAQKIKLKKSHEIKANRLGATTPRMPRLPENDERPLSEIHLIDDDPDTCWSSRTQMSGGCEPSWIRLDLVSEQTVSAVILRKRKVELERTHPGAMPIDSGAYEVGRCMTDSIEIRISRDGMIWDTVYSGDTGDKPDKMDFVYPFSHVRAKMILIRAWDYKCMENLLCSFSIACVEVMNANGENLALVSKGCGISVSSTHAGFGLELETQRWLWPLHHDLGLKWARIGYHDDPINWHHVEKEEGVLSVDPVADGAVTELYENGIQIIMCLDFGNRLYCGKRERRVPQLWQWYYDSPEPPKTERAMTAWENYVRFMVRKYKNRTAVFEIWNEWNTHVYWGDKVDPELYEKVARRAIQAVREEAPDAKVMLGSSSGFPRIHGLSEEKVADKANWEVLLKVAPRLAPLVDVIGFHPFYNLDPASTDYTNYRNDIEAFRKYCEKHGFQGELCASEFNIASNYPQPEHESWWGSYAGTETGKAKQCARVALIHTAHRMGSFFCETYSNAYPMDLSLTRRMFPSYPVMPMQPSASYYVTRNMATLLDGLEPCGSFARIQCEKDPTCLFFNRDNQKAAAFWIDGGVSDVCDYSEASMIVDGQYENIYAVDAMCGTLQKLDFEYKDGHTVIRGLLAGDYPRLVYFE